MDDGFRTSGPLGRPMAVAPEVLARVVEEAPGGIAVADAATQEYVYLNPSGRDLLLTQQGRTEPRSIPAFGLTAEEMVTFALGNRELEHRTTAVSAGGRSLHVTHFRDVTRGRQRERQLAAFGRTSASIAFAGPLGTVLDRLADEVREASDMLACTFLLMDEGGRLRQAGVATQGYPGVEDYAERLEQCRVLGAPLLSLRAFRDRRPLVVHGWREQSLADPRFAPLHSIAGEATWSTLATVPVIGRGAILGVLNGFYLAGAEPSEEDLSFLTAVADLAAVAVENARLVGVMESKAALEERHLIARELHDSVNQALFSLTLQTRALEIGMSAGRFDTARTLRGLAEVRALTEGALAEMRALIFQLRPAALHEEGLVSAVRKLASAMAVREGLDLHVDGVDVEPPLDPMVEEQLFRVVQEALHNIVKHAGAGRVQVLVRVDPDREDALELVITDDGDGFDTDAEHPGHLGLTYMAERVAQVGGRFSVTSVPGNTRVRVWVPDVVRPAGAGAGADADV